eukprot:gnl/TRDRNA2_/TRDRNA2_131093_c0_seq1.p1 gnl/TRDRNA2_/TRDRNA2_131093_c0~~gnl/TRDRNA2_/TRDRNA2_131093_c0_seq1.p1  ORF type:complete len:544 (+),score=144.90 gnl/TRDRNA2_/TRDRNA2_131093_c0_seq1:78-1709(+)
MSSEEEEGYDEELEEEQEGQDEQEAEEFWKSLEELGDEEDGDNGGEPEPGEDNVEEQNIVRNAKGGGNKRKSKESKDSEQASAKKPSAKDKAKNKSSSKQQKQLLTSDEEKGTKSKRRSTKKQSASDEADAKSGSKQKRRPTSDEDGAPKKRKSRIAEDKSQSKRKRRRASDEDEGEDDGDGEVTKRKGQSARKKPTAGAAGGKGRGRGGRKRQKMPSEKDDDLAFGRTWTEYRIGGEKVEGCQAKKMKNVKFSAEESQRILEAVKMTGREKGENEEIFLDSIRDERQVRFTWSKIATISDMPHRSVQSIVQRARRIMHGGHGVWTEEQLKELRGQVLQHGPKWKDIAESLGCSPEHCKDKWKALCVSQKKGQWSGTEVWALRQGICDVTGELVPVSNIKWKRVQAWVPHRTSEQCRTKWYKDVLPKLLTYQSKHGYPIDTDVFQRVIIRYLHKHDHGSEDQVPWVRVNKWWSAQINHEFFKRLCRSVPESRAEEPLKDRVAWLYTALECQAFRSHDKKLLRHAENTLEAQARQMPEDEQEAE